jgi:hypothetical protein
MITKDIPTSATGVSTIWSALDEVKQHLHVVSNEHNVSEVLMLVTLRDWADRQLRTPIDLPR